MFVTCYYDIYNKPENFDLYSQWFHTVTEFPMILFTDPSLVSKFNFPMVTVVGIPLETFELYSIAHKYNVELPSHRSELKDTKDFLALMNTKIEFIKRASEMVEDDTFIWIDYGIFKIIKNRELAFDKLKQIQNMKYTHITIPGCWDAGLHYSNDSVYWRFCGGFFVIPRHHIDTFYDYSKNVLTDLCTQHKLTWETNIWYMIEQKTHGIIQWYSADHNDSIILNL